jgi:hypothetical protein
MWDVTSPIGVACQKQMGTNPRVRRCSSYKMKGLPVVMDAT